MTAAAAAAAAAPATNQKGPNVVTWLVRVANTPAAGKTKQCGVGQCYSWQFSLHMLLMTHARRWNSTRRCKRNQSATANKRSLNADVLCLLSTPRHSRCLLLTRNSWRV
jgi:hypothetical protein